MILFHRFVKCVFYTAVILANSPKFILIQQVYKIKYAEQLWKALLLRIIVLNQKTITIIGPELLKLDFRTSKTEEILILRTNHQLYFVLKMRIPFVSHILKSYKNPGRPKVRDSVNQIIVSYKPVSLRLSVMQNLEQNPCFHLKAWT